MRWATYRHLRAVDAALQQRWLLGKVDQISSLLVVDLVRHTLAGFVRGPSMRIKIMLLTLILLPISVIGYLDTATPGQTAPFLAAFRKGPKFWIWWTAVIW